MSLITTDKYIRKISTNLQKLDLSFEDFQNSIYCGGDHDEHLNYWNQYWTTKKIYDKKLPEHNEKCLCEHPIEKNCYVHNRETDQIIVLGNCCIKRFVTKSKRTCDRCGDNHRNTKLNFCNTCHPKCRRCHKKVYNDEKHCDWCIDNGYVMY
jgi:hypothetical protein